MPEPSPSPPSPPLSWGARFWFAVVILIGPAYLFWMTGVEGRRLWIVVGLIFLIAGCATLAHWLMGLTRRGPHPPDPPPTRPPDRPGEGGR